MHARSVTTGTASRRTRRSVHVLRMIEANVEALVEASRKVLQPGIVATDIRVANQAHRHGGRGELTAMTVSTRFVTGKTWCRGVVGSFVAGVAGNGSVTLAGVKEF